MNTNKKKSMSARLVSLLLAMVLVVTMVPAIAFATNEETQIHQTSGQTDESGNTTESDNNTGSSTGDDSTLGGDNTADTAPVDEGAGESSEEGSELVLNQDGEGAALVPMSEVVALEDVTTLASGGISAAKFVDDNGTFDLVAQAGTANYPTVSSTTANNYPLQVTAAFPTGATITDKQIEIVLPVGLTWGQDSTGVAQVTDRLVGGNAGITKPAAYDWSQYGVTTQQGRLYKVKSLSDGLDVDALTLNVTAQRNINVQPQTLTGAENHFKIIVSWKENGVLESETIDVGGLVVNNLEALPYYHSNGTSNNTNVAAGDSVEMMQRVIVGAPTNGNYTNSGSFTLSVSYTPKDGTAQADTTHLLSLDDSKTNQYSLSGGTDGVYTATLKNTPCVWNTNGNISLLLDLSDPSLKTGDVISITASPIAYDFYSGISGTTASGKTWTYTINNESKVRVYDRSPAGTGRLINRGEAQAHLLYFGGLENTGGSASESMDVTIDLAPSNGIVGVSPSRMTLPLESGKTIQTINYVLADGKSGTLTGSFTGDGDGALELTLADWQNAGLADNSYLKTISYTMGKVPANYLNINAIRLYGYWLDESTAATAVSVSLDYTNTSGAASTTTLKNSLIDRAAVIGFNVAPVTKSSNAGDRYDFQYRLYGGAITHASAGLMESPVFYIRNECGGTLDIKSIKVIQSMGNVNITSQCVITDMGTIAGAHVYKIDTANVTSNNGRDAWIGTLPYFIDDEGTETLDGQWQLKVQYSVQTRADTPGGKYYYDQAFFVGHNDESLKVTGMSTNAVLISDTYGLTSPAVHDLIAWKGTRFYEIAGKADLIAILESKSSDEATDAFTNVDYSGGLTTGFSDTHTADMRLSLINPSGVTIEKGMVFIPIPKEGQAWGTYSDGAFPFSMELAAPLTNPDDNKFTILYGVATPSGDGAAINTGTSWESYNASNAKDYNVIKVVCDGLPYINTGSTDEEKRAANTWPFETTVSFVFNDAITDDMVVSWTPLYYEVLTIPGTGAGTGLVSGWQAPGAKIALQPQLGQLGGTLWLDENKNSVMDPDEGAPSPAEGWNLYLFKAADFDAAAYESDPAGWLALNENAAKYQTQTGADASYFFDLLDRTETYSMVLANADTSEYFFSELKSDMDFSYTRTTTGKVSLDPYAVREVSQAGTHIYATDGSSDSLGIYNIGLYQMRYSVIYDANKGAAVQGKSGLTWSDEVALPDTSRTGYSHAGWALSHDGVSAQTGASIASGTEFSELAAANTVENITLKAQWTAKTYNVSYKGNGNTAGTAPDSHPAVFDKTFTVAGAGDLARQGYTFAGWNTAANGSGTAYAAGATPTHTTPDNITLYAQWDPAGVAYTINHYRVDAAGSIVATETEHRTALTGSTVTAAARSYAPSYSYKANYPGTIASGTVAANGSLELNLFYTQNTYTVTFVDYNGAILATRAGVPYGGSALAPGNPVRAGYTFTGWDRTFSNVTSNLTVTALYTPIPTQTETFTVTFLDHDDSIIESFTVNSGESVTPPTVNRHNGYTFERWDTDESAWTNVTEDATIKAICNNQSSVTTPASTTTTTTPNAPVERSIAAAAAEQGIPNIGVPLVAPPGFAAWALLNLILAVVALIYAVVMLVAFIRRRKNFNDDIEDAKQRRQQNEGQNAAYVQAGKDTDNRDTFKQQKGLALIIIMALFAVASVVLFVLTQDMSFDMVWADGWTIFNALLLVAALICGTVGILRTKKVEIETDDTETASTAYVSMQD